MSRLLHVLGLAGAVLFVSCQMTAQTQRPAATAESRPEQVKLFSSPHDVVWTAALDVLAQRGWTVSSQTRDAGIITTGVVSLTDGSAYMSCQSGRRSSLTGHRATLEIEVDRVSASGARVRVSGSFEAADPSGTGEGRRVACSSNGRLEAEFFAAMDSVIAARR